MSRRNPADTTLRNLAKTRRDVARLTRQLRAHRATTTAAMRGLRREGASWRARVAVLTRRIAGLERKAGM